MSHLIIERNAEVLTTGSVKITKSESDTIKCCLGLGEDWEPFTVSN